MHTFCFLEALMLPFVLGESPAVEIRSARPIGGEVSAVVTERAWRLPRRGTVVLFGPARAGMGTICETLCPYLNAFPSQTDYERWAEEMLQAQTIVFSLRRSIRPCAKLGLGFRGESCCRCSV